MPAKTESRTAHLVAPCAHCGEPARLDTSNPWRPFCSERCKMLDLGQWFSGQYSIAEPEEQDSTDLSEPDPRHPQ